MKIPSTNRETEMFRRGIDIRLLSQLRVPSRNLLERYSTRYTTFQRFHCSDASAIYQNRACNDVIAEWSMYVYYVQRRTVLRTHIGEQLYRMIHPYTNKNILSIKLLHFRPPHVRSRIQDILHVRSTIYAWMITVLIDEPPTIVLGVPGTSTCTVLCLYLVFVLSFCHRVDLVLYVQWVESHTASTLLVHSQVWTVPGGSGILSLAGNKISLNLRRQKRNFRNPQVLVHPGVVCSLGCARNTVGQSMKDMNERHSVCLLQSVMNMKIDSSTRINRTRMHLEQSYYSTLYQECSRFALQNKH